jgi:CBS domain-containing protein
MAIGSICVREVDTARPDETVSVAAERMHQRAVGALVVVNTSDQVIGMITDRDLVSRVLAKNRNPMETTIRDIMTLSPKTITELTPIKTALLTMRTGRFRRIPVVGHDRKLVGLICLDDILMLLAEEFSQVGRLLKRETPRALVEEPNSSMSGVSRFQSEARSEVGD